MRVKIKVGDNKVEFNMSKSQALLIVKWHRSSKKCTWQMSSQYWIMRILNLTRTEKHRTKLK